MTDGQCFGRDAECGQCRAEVNLAVTGLDEAPPGFSCDDIGVPGRWLFAILRPPSISGTEHVPVTTLIVKCFL